MKKNTFITVMLFFISFSLSAQFVTITNVNKIPTVGDVATYVNANPFGFDAAGTGPITNKIWDFSGLATQGTPTIFEFVDPLTIANGDGSEFFPTATLARKQTGVTGHFYYQNTANKIDRLGFYGNPSSYGFYTDGTKATEFQFPIAGGQSYTSTYNGDFAPFGVGEDSVKITDGILTITADAQGQMSLPSQTFGVPTGYTNVLRVRIVESFRIKTYFQGIVLVNNLIEDDYYYWFVNSQKFPILASGVTKLDGAIPAGSAPVLRYLQSSPLATSNVSTTVSSIYPNPSNGIFSLNLKNNNENAAIEVHNTLGQKVLTTIHSNQIDLSNQNPGIYFAKITVDGNTQTERIILK